MKQIIHRSVAEHILALQKKEYSAVELTRAYLAQIAKTDGSIGAFLYLNEEAALTQAEQADRLLAANQAPSPLCGIPFALKDNICTKGIPTTCASRMLEGYLPPYNATVAEKLQRAGAILLGKLNMDEFAVGSTTELSAYGVTKNPLDPTRIPGGSSGGCAAAVAASQVPLTLGSDTGGSVRLPAAFCGVVGLRPTYGAVSRYGLVAFASSLDQIGPITATVEDTSLLFDVIRGKDPKDATTLSYEERTFQKDIASLRIGIPKELFAHLSEDVESALQNAIRTLSLMGATLCPVSLPSAEAALSAYYILSSAEFSSNLSRFDGVRYGHRASAHDSIDALYCASRAEGFGEEVKRRILLGTFVLCEGHYDAYYRKAQQVRQQLREEFAMAFAHCDLLLCPTSPTVAYPLGEKRDDPVARYREDLYCVPASMAGLPALTLPCATGENGLPVGMQLIGSAFSESLLFYIGKLWENGYRGGKKHD